MNTLDTGTATNLALLIVLIGAVVLILLRTGSRRHRIAQRVRQEKGVRPGFACFACIGQLAGRQVVKPARKDGVLVPRK